jgi:hypothetical protein
LGALFSALARSRYVTGPTSTGTVSIPSCHKQACDIRSYITRKTSPALRTTKFEANNRYTNCHSKSTTKECIITEYWEKYNLYVLGFLVFIHNLLR